MIVNGSEFVRYFESVARAEDYAVSMLRAGYKIVECYAPTNFVDKEDGIAYKKGELIFEVKNVNY